MIVKPFTPVIEWLLFIIAIIGLTVPNGFFLYYSFAQPELGRAAMSNPVSSIYIIEAFFLMFLFSWFIHKQKLKSPGWAAFMVMSLIGSMVFSVPMFLFLTSRKLRKSAAK